MKLMNSLLLAEFYTATGYLDRLLFAFAELEKMHLTSRGKIQIQKLCYDFANFFSDNFDHLHFTGQDYIFELSQFKNHIKCFHFFIESMIKLPIGSDRVNRHIIEYINFIYRNTSEIHNFISEKTTLDIQLPRTGLTEIKNFTANTTSPIPLFYLDEKNIQDITNLESVKNSPLSFLEIKREEKYNHYVQQGHLLIAQKNFQEANAQFYKARNYKDTAEVLTLIAWTYSLLDKIKDAKAYCMKAIQRDIQYGPAYNDFGNYILNEGQVQESLRWFELAKRAHNYQNREYPYINAGRAYVLLKKYEDGLNEFSLALTLAPHHHELHETVAKLRNNLDLETHPPLPM